MTSARLEVLPATALFERATDLAADAVREAISEKGRCSIALSGGATPAPLFHGLAAADVEWSAVDIIQVDERVAPPGHPDRNLTLIERDFRDRIDGPKPPVHAMDVTTHRLDDAARTYAATLEGVCGRPPVIDVVHLGLGPDGHIASLVPNDPVLEERDRWVAVTRPYRGYVRMTLTYPVLDNARLVVFLVVGGDKADALASLTSGDPSVPAGRLAARNVVVFADPAASGER